MHDLVFSLPEEEKVKLYKDILKLYGWPEWPPLDTPPLRNWWKDNIVELPGIDTIKIPNLLTFQLNGTSNAGKSTLELPLQNALTSKLKERNMGDVKLEILNDPVASTSSSVLDLALEPFLDSDALPPVLEKDDWTTTLFLQISKSLFWNERLRFPQHYTDLNTRTIQLVNRGPTDALIWSYSILTHRGDPNFEIPEFFKKMAQNQLLDITADLQTLSGYAHANIFVGLDQKVAQKRREDAHKVDPGWVTDSPMFETYSSWAGYFIDSVYPNMKTVKNSGLLVVDGEQESQVNVGIITDYIVESAWRLFPGNY